MQRERHHQTSRPVKQDRILSWSNDGSEPAELMSFVMEKMPDRSRTDIKSWLRHGQMTIDGTVTTIFNAAVAPGAKV